jgi:hypothetical protein
MAVLQSTPDLLSPDVPLPRNASMRLAWAAGFFEGEGYFGPKSGGIRIVVTQVQRCPLDWLQTMFGGRVHARLTAQAKPCWSWMLSGPTAASLMMTCYLFMSQNRRAHIRARLATWYPKRIASRYAVRCIHGHHFTPFISKHGGIRRRCLTCRDIDRPNQARRNRQRRERLKIQAEQLSL